MYLWRQYQEKEETKDDVLSEHYQVGGGGQRDSTRIAFLSE